MTAEPTHTPLRHGYTLTQLENMARAAALSHRHSVRDVDERIADAHHAMVIALYESDDPPEVGALYKAAYTGISLADRDHRHHYGYNERNMSAGAHSMPGFQRYWGGPSHQLTHEDRLVERIALAQIWPQLTPRQQQAVSALAFAGDYWEAARLIESAEGTYSVLLSKARVRFAQWWHEGETPTRHRRDTRMRGRSGYVGGKRRLTESQLDDIRRRHYEDGEYQKDLAAEYGISPKTLSNLLSGKFRAAPDQPHDA